MQETKKIIRFDSISKIFKTDRRTDIIFNMLWALYKINKMISWKGHHTLNYTSRTNSLKDLDFTPHTYKHTLYFTLFHVFSSVSQHLHALSSSLLRFVKLYGVELLTQACSRYFVGASFL